MPYCLNPICQKPNNPDGREFCANCGSRLDKVWRGNLQTSIPEYPLFDLVLRQLLEQLTESLNFGQWQEGDRLTNEIILGLTNKSQIAKLTADDINQIPCDIWIAIDQAWMQASNHRFGWSAQQQIWKRLGGRLIYEQNTYWEFANIYEKFSDRVGWRKPRWLNLSISPKVWRKYENLTFAIAAPTGHLPSLLFWEGFNLVDTIFYRLEVCADRRSR